MAEAFLFLLAMLMLGLGLGIPVAVAWLIWKRGETKPKITLEKP